MDRRQVTAEFRKYAAKVPELGVLIAEARLHKAARRAMLAGHPRREYWGCCANQAWYGYAAVSPENGLKARLSELVGFERKIPGQMEYVEVGKNQTDGFKCYSLAEWTTANRHVIEHRNNLIESLPQWERELMTSKAYSICYEAIYDSLPDCDSTCCE